ncbi:hypothetical protein [Gallionella capsiferriformans]|jgi:hypothetical protein|uniref:Uncharacterized protein n=1 Tax=Gallionella capsiferriformans (strain ES-2) TaxID=395494 RepID=D9SGL4_GALCS|nr:hypothetical protein [Gallionella capsiferriformans]ADL55661.1 hypothetical protein Galf_1645 [Gallionella capsiferriformans ES-2]
MEQQFSPGLLYAVAPEDLRELHLQDDAETVEWEEPESKINTLTHAICDFFHKTAK